MKNNLAKNFCLILMFTGMQLHAQTAEEHVKNGNEKYRQQDYAGAQQEYEKAVSTTEGAFNLGNAYYAQENYELAAEQYNKAAVSTDDPTIRADAYHNLGNALLEQQKYEESIQAYKNALKDAPDNADTKYNLSYALQMLKKKQEQQQQQKQQQEEKKQEQKKQEQEQQPDKDQPENKEPDPSAMSNEELERVLKSLQEDDKAVQDKINKQKAKSTGGEPEKDW